MEYLETLTHPEPDPMVLFQHLGLSLVLGLLVGLQRQRTDRGLAGMRTFPLITVLRTMSAFLARVFGGWVLAAGFVGVVAVIAIRNFDRLRETRGDEQRGITTEIAVLLMFAVGAFLAVGPPVIGVAVGAGVAVLLQFKPELHGFASRLGDEDLKAIMRFVLISCIILPVLPNQTFGPYDVLNPFEIWLMVVLIVGISLTGYVVYKFVGQNTGILVGGVLGGAISSTATTVSYARRTVNDDLGVLPSTVVVVLAASVVYIRVLFEISVVAPDFLSTAAWPIGAMMALTLLPGAMFWLGIRHQSKPMPKQGNPTEIRAALLFASLYAAVLLGLTAAKSYWGNEAMFLVAIISGLTDMDAITLSTSRLVAADRLDMHTGWRLIVTATIANLVFKTFIVGLLGNRQLLKHVIMLFSIPAVGGILLVLLV